MQISRDVSNAGCFCTQLAKLGVGKITELEKGKPKDGKNGKVRNPAHKEVVRTPLIVILDCGLDLRAWKNWHWTQIVFAFNFQKSKEEIQPHCAMGIK